MFGGGPILVSLASFTCYTALGYPLTAAVAFPALALFNLLRFPVSLGFNCMLPAVHGRHLLQACPEASLPCQALMLLIDLCGPAGSMVFASCLKVFGDPPAVDPHVAALLKLVLLF